MVREGARYQAGQLTEMYKALNETVGSLKNTLGDLAKAVNSINFNSLAKETEKLREASEKANEVQKLANEHKEKSIALDDKTQKMFRTMLTNQNGLIRMQKASIRIQKEATKSQKELTAAKKDDEEAIDPNEWKKRTRIIGDAIKDLEKDGKKFEIFSRETFKAYQKQGGNFADYLAEGILGTREEIQILGVEAGKFRRILYGFAPPGTFGLLNKLAAPLQVIGGALREMNSSAKGAEESYGNLFKTMLKFGKKSIDLFKVDARASRLSKKIDTSSIFKDAKLRRQETIDAMSKDERRQFFNSKDAQRKLNQKIFGAATKDADTFKKFRQEREIRAKNSSALFRNIFRGKDNKIKLEPEMSRKDFYKLYKDFLKLKVFLFKNSAVRFFGKAGTAIKKLLPVVLAGFMKFFLVFSFVMIGIWLIVKKFGPTLKEIWIAFQEYFAKLVEKVNGFFERVGGIFGPLVGGFGMIVDSFKKGGTFEELIDGLLLFLGGIILAALSTLGILITGAIALVIIAIKKAGKALVDGFLESLRTLKGLWKLFSLVVAGVVFFMSGAWIAVLVGALVYWIGMKFGKMIGLFADGGTVNTPMQIVGEEGPELVTLPKGAQVTNAKKTSQIMGNKSYNTNNTFNITVNAKDTSDAELRRIAQKIGNMVNTNINRSVSSRTLG